MFSMIFKIFFMLVMLGLIICLFVVLPAAENNIREIKNEANIAAYVPPRAHRVVNSNQQSQ